MKRKILYLIICFFSFSVLGSACSERENHKQNPHKSGENRYMCPMKCTDQHFSKPGTCPSCGMDLTLITES